MKTELKDVNILVTRQKHQANRFAQLLRYYGGIPYVTPLLKIEEKPFSIPHLKSFKWLIFTSGNGVRYFMDHLNDINQLEHIKIAVVGKKTNQTLQTYGFEAEFMPSEFRAKALANEFFLHDPNPKKLLLVRGELSRKEFELELINREQQYETIEVYNTLPNIEIQSYLNTVLTQVKLDYITFTSPTTVRFFCKMSARKLENNPGIVCIGSTTAEVAYQYGFQNIIVPSEFTIEGMIQTILTHQEKEQKHG